jgi:hypothetical protein
VTVTGKNLTGATAVTFGGTAVKSFTVVDATTITAVTPAHAAGTVAVAVTTPGGTGTRGAAFTYVAVGAAPKIVSVSPSNGPAAGGTVVTITGTNFTGTTAVTFGGTAVTSFTTVSATTISAVTAAHTAATVDVAVTTVNGSATAAAAFTYAGMPRDSQRLRDTQVVLTNLAAQSSSSTISAAASQAVSDGFGDGGPLVSQSGDALRFSYAGEKPSRVEDAFAAVGKPAKAKFLPESNDWRLWGQVGGTGWNSTAAAGDITGGQIQALAGVTRKLSPNFLVGLMAGYESYNYSIASLDGALKGGGWTIGSYLGWNVTEGVQFDASLARTGVEYKASAGTASGDIPAVRWVGSAALRGTAKFGAVRLEPSVSAYVFREEQEAYVDSLGTPQADRDVTAGRTSAGAKTAYRFLTESGIPLTPYVGLYGDYYFSSDTTLTTGLSSNAVLTGWSARMTAGLGMELGNKRFMFGGELGGLGSDYTMWSVKGNLIVPLN